jgi:pimeloyl-ACP methyl ester carboxylesterase
MLKSFVYDTAQIHYRDEGEGTAVMLLHGFGEDGQIWDQQIRFLKTHCRVIVPDIPGSGASDLLRETTNTIIGINTYAAVINALLDHENIEHCILLGHSMGGYIALAFAEMYPERLEAFGLIHSTAFADTEEKKQIRRRGIEIIGEYGAGAFLKTTIPNLFGKSFKETQSQQIDVLIKKGQSFSSAALQQYYASMIERPDRTAVLQGNRLPVLFVIGTEDNAAPMADVMQQTPLPDISYIHVLPGIGHMGMWEAPDQLNKILLAFVYR